LQGINTSSAKDVNGEYIVIVTIKIRISSSVQSILNFVILLSIIIIGMEENGNVPRIKVLEFMIILLLFSNIIDRVIGKN
jgi:hypothetical protein